MAASRERPKKGAGARYAGLSQDAFRQIKINIEDFSNIPDHPETWFAEDIGLRGQQVSALADVGVFEVAAKWVGRGTTRKWRLTERASEAIKELEEEMEEGGYGCCRFSSGFNTVDLDAEKPYECSGCGARHTREETLEADF